MAASDLRTRLRESSYDTSSCEDEEDACTYDSSSSEDEGAGEDERESPSELGDAKCASDSGASANSPSSWLKREALLEEAWERKRKLMLQEELSTLEDRAEPERLGRSASCVKPLSNLLKVGHLSRSVSSCGSLTDLHFEELQGCIDLGFRFDKSAIWDLCNTFPALEVCAAVAQNIQDSSCSTSPTSSLAQSFTPSPTFSWTIASPGDDDEQVKEKLRHWAQAVRFNTKLDC